MNGALAAWVPGEVLVAVLAMALGALYKLVLDRSKKTDDKLEKLAAIVIELDKKFVSTASLEQLGRMGDRFDGRITSISQEVAVIKAVSARGDR